MNSKNGTAKASDGDETGESDKKLRKIIEDERKEREEDIEALRQRIAVLAGNEAELDGASLVSITLPPYFSIFVLESYKFFCSSSSISNTASSEKIQYKIQT